MRPFFFLENFILLSKFVDIKVTSQTLNKLERGLAVSYQSKVSYQFHNMPIKFSCMLLLLVSEKINEAKRTRTLPETKIFSHMYFSEITNLFAGLRNLLHL